MASSPTAPLLLGTRATTSSWQERDADMGGLVVCKVCPKRASSPIANSSSRELGKTQYMRSLTT
eukprot:CAMPEP_0115185170 /NCGR_PEP_ID=MMETSP0270-20121206/9333_1 /TAXON_ID=71861 /ORGANISM="Scrippsiella trochoidea, Strain CCMP3099" /LENGTH=63 /DNA_ID=CAMNT_0002598265 /DNA_START=986 /DNA_END=1177 /DNA_ORIENTATION=+